MLLRDGDGFFYAERGRIALQDGGVWSQSHHVPAIISHSDKPCQAYCENVIADVKIDRLFIVFDFAKASRLSNRAGRKDAIS